MPITGGVNVYASRRAVRCARGASLRNSQSSFPARWASPLLTRRKVRAASSSLILTVAVAGTALLLGATSVLLAQQDPATASAPVVIQVVAKRFTFEPSRIEVAEGDHVRLVVRSGDGVHGIGIKKFKVETVVPRGGEPVTVDFVASVAGSFPIVCSEYCGKGHDAMKGTLVVSVRK